MGVGKTHATKQVADALGLQCVIVPSDVLPQRAEMLGGISPITREVIKGKARDCYENGGVLVIDELDRGHPSLGTALNHLLAGSDFDFDKDGGGTVNVKKHPDFVVLATANTYGTGSSLRYVGANKLDQAGLDRFTFVHVNCDEKMTSSILKATDADSALQVLPIWLQARRNVERYGLDVCVSPRVAIDVQEYLIAGLSLERACVGRLHKRGLNADLESKLLEGITF
jgi:cobaltochelatase CobS